MSRRGFTMVEVLIALVLLEIGVVGAVGIMALAGRILSDAERVERAVAAVEGVADSLRATHRSPVAGRRSVAGVGRVEWVPLGTAFQVVAVAGADTLIAVVVPGRPGS